MAAAAWQSPSQEEILKEALASLDEQDIPPDDDAWAFPDPDCDRPPELEGLTTAELDELFAAPPSGQAGSAWPAERGKLGSAAADLVPEAGPAGFADRDGPGGGGAGFAEGGVLDELAPGVPLAGFAEEAQAGIAGLSDDELVGVLRAWRRQASWAQARELAAIAELARRRPADRTPPAAPGRFPDQMSEFVADEVALALTLTRRAAGAGLDLALGLAARPGTAALLAAGRIDLPRARVILDGVAGLAAGHAAAVEAAVLAPAPGLTTGQLRAAVARAVLAADPEAARRDRQERLRDARVECWPDPTGTANLAGRDLPPAETLAADRRLCQIAWAWTQQIRAAWKHADPDRQQPRPAAGTDLLRARAYLALLLGQPVDSAPADLLPPAGTGAYPGCGADPRSGPDGTGGPGGPGQSRDGQSAAAGPDGGHRPAGLCRDSRPAPALAAPGPGSGLPPLAGQVFLTLPLATLLGLADAPGEAAGYGPVDPDTGRALARAAAGHPAAGWHLILTDPGGRAVGYGHAPRARPARPPPPAGPPPAATPPTAGPSP